MTHAHRNLVEQYCYPRRTWERRIDARIEVDTYFANRAQRQADWQAGFLVIGGVEYPRPA